jgi:fluoride exporter
MSTSFYMLLSVGAGGFIGSIARYGLQKLFENFGPTPGSYVGTFLSNIIACLVLGVAFAWSIKHTEWDSFIRTGLMVGFCGGLSTFSALSMDVYQWIQAGRWSLAIGYTIASICTGYFAIWLGIYFSR